MWDWLSSREECDECGGNSGDDDDDSKTDDIMILVLSSIPRRDTMIDWVSIVRHSRRRFSNYMYAVPSKVRNNRRVRRKRKNNGNGRDRSSSFRCDCCCLAHKFQKARFNGGGGDLPPPPSPPQINELTALDGVPRSVSPSEHIVLRDGLKQTLTLWFANRLEG
ncbi:hypothetical protein RUM43_002131 [Polyplax serrata]|uniref:Uncharacterized protein n=1 Tax=Polyplax serrata TaxID=468196 RepID=A0AAN8NSV3_POLSC